MHAPTQIDNVWIYDGSGSAPYHGSVFIADGRIAEDGLFEERIDGQGLALAPGFIDVHTHDDLFVLREPSVLPKLSQGVTTVIVGNCGISAAPVTDRRLPDPMNLLGAPEEFRFRTFAEYVQAVEETKPAINVAALVGHTTLRSNHLDRLDRTATPDEVAAMRAQLQEGLDHGALGLSTGLAYLSAFSAETEEVIGLAEPLAKAGAIYTTHMRSETAEILDAMSEAFRIGGQTPCPVVISHLKCAGIDNWGRSGEVLKLLDEARAMQPIGCDCYPYSAGSSTLDLRQVDPRVKIMITWSEPHPEMAGKTLAEISLKWQVEQLEAAQRLMPAGAIYHSISESDMHQILRHPATMIGSDGLPSDPRPHPRLWGTFPRVLGHYARDRKFFSLATAIHKMTGLPAARFNLKGLGTIQRGAQSDLVLFDPATIADTAWYDDPKRPANGIKAVWVNGELAYTADGPTGKRAGRFIKRNT